jgi:hypothetical protein
MLEGYNQGMKITDPILSALQKTVDLELIDQELATSLWCQHKKREREGFDWHNETYPQDEDEDEDEELSGE